MSTEVVDWVTTHFLPFEAQLRVMLRRVCGGPEDIDDVVQEVYYRVLVMDRLDHVKEPRAFLVRMAKNIVTDRLRRESIVSIEAMASIEDLGIEDAAPTPERVVQARSELTWVFGLIANLPERCRQVFQARRIEGLSQKETAETLGISEGIVEQETMKGMHLISDMVGQVGLQEGGRPARHSKRTGGKKNVND